MPHPLRTLRLRQLFFLQVPRSPDFWRLIWPWFFRSFESPQATSADWFVCENFFSFSHPLADERMLVGMVAPQQGCAGFGSTFSLGDGLGLLRFLRGTTAISQDSGFCLEVARERDSPSSWAVGNCTSLHFASATIYRRIRVLVFKQLYVFLVPAMVPCRMPRIPRE